MNQIKTLAAKTWMMDYQMNHNKQDSFDEAISSSCSEADLILTNREEIRQLAGIFLQWKFTIFWTVI